MLPSNSKLWKDVGKVSKGSGFCLFAKRRYVTHHINLSCFWEKLKMKRNCLKYFLCNTFQNYFNMQRVNHWISPPFPLCHCAFQVNFYIKHTHKAYNLDSYTAVQSFFTRCSIFSIRRLLGSEKTVCFIPLYERLITASPIKWNINAFYNGEWSNAFEMIHLSPGNHVFNDCQVFTTVRQFTSIIWQSSVNKQWWDTYNCTPTSCHLFPKPISNIFCIKTK